MREALEILIGLERHRQASFDEGYEYESDFLEEIQNFILRQECQIVDLKRTTLGNSRVRETIDERDEEIRQLRETIDQRDEEHRNLHKILHKRDKEIKKLKKRLDVWEEGTMQQYYDLKEEVESAFQL